MRPPGRSWLGLRLLLAVALALVTSATAAAGGQLISTPGHSGAVVALHAGAEGVVVLTHRHGIAGGAVAGLAPPSAVPPMRVPITAARTSARGTARPTGAVQPRGPPQQLSDN